MKKMFVWWAILFFAFWLVNRIVDWSTGR